MERKFDCPGAGQPFKVIAGYDYAQCPVCGLWEENFLLGRLPTVPVPKHHQWAEHWEWEEVAAELFDEVRRLRAKCGEV